MPFGYPLYSAPAVRKIVPHIINNADAFGRGAVVLTLNSAFFRASKTLKVALAQIMHTSVKSHSVSKKLDHLTHCGPRSVIGRKLCRQTFSKDAVSNCYASLDASSLTLVLSNLTQSSND